MSDVKPKRSFEDCFEQISALVERKRMEWTFKASVYQDFDDIKQEIVTHIWKKWHLFDQERPLAAWVNTIVSNQFINILRDIYLSTSSPCQRCPCNTGNNLCSVYGEQGVACPLYKKWYGSKRYSHQAKLPVTIEDHINELQERGEDSFDFDKASLALHIKIKDRLTKSEWEIYRRLYIEHKSEEVAAIELGFKTSEKGRKCGYKRIRKVRSIVVKIAKEILKRDGVDGAL